MFRFFALERLLDVTQNVYSTSRPWAWVGVTVLALLIIGRARLDRLGRSGAWHPYPSSYKEETLANLGKKVRSRSTGVIHLIRAWPVDPD